MAYTTVQDLFTGICDSIRAKEKTTAPINHQDIPTRIANLPTSSTCEIQKITLEDLALLPLMQSWVHKDEMGFVLYGPDHSAIKMNGKIATIFLMFKYYDGGEWYSFWVAGSAVRGNTSSIGVGAVSWGEEVGDEYVSLNFKEDGTLFLSIKTPGINLTGEGRFVDISGIAVSYNEGAMPSLGA